METQGKWLLPAEAKPLQRRIESWRRSRRGGEPMPGDLWRAATALARKHGVSLIARGLPVDYGALKKRVEGDGGGFRGAGAGGGIDLGDDVAAPLFVEFGAAPLMGSSGGDGAVVELARPDGTRMVVRLPAGASLDLARLAAAFCGGGA